MLIRESEWSNLDSYLEAQASSSESSFDTHLDINEDNSLFMDISHSCLVFRWNFDGILMSKYLEVTSKNFI